MSGEYQQVEELLNAGAGMVFVTGAAGTGKSTLIQHLRSALHHNMAVVAPTGIAALNVQGQTIHSFFRLPPHVLGPQDIKRLPDRRLHRRLELLVVDEVSMVRADTLDAIDLFLRTNRENSAPFGGVQVLLVGDLHQLPPVVKNEEERSALEQMGYPKAHSIDSRAWSEYYPVVLRHSYRHSQDPSFFNVLSQVRSGENAAAVAAYLNEHCLGKKISGVTLTATNAGADCINEEELDRIPGNATMFDGRYSGRFPAEKDNLPSPLNLSLKVGARVMFTKNDGNHRWVNGTLGTVANLRGGKISVIPDRAAASTTYDVPQVTWERYAYQQGKRGREMEAKKSGEYTQYPLTLAWAVTIHKSQGQTLDKVHLDLGYGAFACGQFYVALSRCRSIDDISLEREISAGDIKVDPLIVEYYEDIERHLNGKTSSSL